MLTPEGKRILQRLLQKYDRGYREFRDHPQFPDNIQEAEASTLLAFWHMFLQELQTHEIFSTYIGVEFTRGVVALLVLRGQESFVLKVSKKDLPKGIHFITYDDLAGTTPGNIAQLS